MIFVHSAWRERAMVIRAGSRDTIAKGGCEIPVIARETVSRDRANCRTRSSPWERKENDLQGLYEDEIGRRPQRAWNRVLRTARKNDFEDVALRC